MVDSLNYEENMEVKKILEQYRLTVQPKYSQSFLHSQAVVDRIVEGAKLQSYDVVLEIGTGLGILTKALVKKVKKVITIEKDTHLSSYLAQEIIPHPKIELIMADFLTFDLENLKSRYSRIKVVANLPYHISTEILFRLFNERHWVDSMTLMFQKEVAQRIIASPGNKNYGVLSVLSQLYTNPRLCFFVSKGNFYPAPKVDSQVVYFEMRKELIIPLPQEALFIKIVKAGFGQRRKMLSNTLQKIFSEERIRILEQKSGLDLKRRMETFSLEEIKKLTSMAFELQD